MNPTSGALGQLFSYFALREDPFHVSPSQRFYFSTNGHDSALVELLWGLESRQGLLVLTGQAGTGKTTVINRILRWMESKQRSSAYVFHTCLEPMELLELVLRDFGIPYTSTRKVDLVAALHHWVVARNAVGDSPVLILDEAQVLSNATLDELRLLLNLETDSGKLLQIILAGQLELEDKLRHPELHQLRQRVMIHSRLSPLTLEETKRYIASRLTVAGASDHALFPLETVQAIHVCSRGIPRLVNLLCKDALVSAYVGQEHAIAPDRIYDIAAELGLTGSRPVPSGHDSSGPPRGPHPPRNPSSDIPARPSHVVDRRTLFFVDAVPEPNDLAESAPASETESAAEPAAVTQTSAAFPPVQTSLPLPAEAASAAEFVSPELASKAEAEEPAAESIDVPAIVRYCADASDFLGRYWEGVTGSFVRDIRSHVDALAPKMTATGSVLSPETHRHLRKRFFVRVARWLHGPMTPRDVRGVTHPVRATPKQL